MPVSRDAVLWGFRLLLGREADSEEAIEAHCALDGERHLAEVLVASPEFAEKRRFAHPPGPQGDPPPAAARPLTREAVEWGFRLFFGREPESEQAVAVHLALGDEQRLAEVLAASPEFMRHPRCAAPPAFADPQPCKILLLGNCQAAGLAKLMQMMADGVAASALELTAQNMARLRGGDLAPAALAAAHDLILLHPNAETARLFAACGGVRAKVRQIPSVSFSAFHPDLVYVSRRTGGHAVGPLGEYQSSIAFYGWRHGLDVAQTLDLFAEDVFARLGFFDHWQSSVDFLERMATATGVPLSDFLERWSSHGCWMHSVNHPKLFVLADVARAVLAQEGIAALPGVEDLLHDDLADGPVWPVY
ncbi:MAG: WcbI family polysaccharide biosynthesis putative acetyltransferase, partial [Candidatus Methylumidiphilus sp.]